MVCYKYKILQSRSSDETSKTLRRLQVLCPHRLAQKTVSNTLITAQRGLKLVVLSGAQAYTTLPTAH
jgi:hypothetical protein